MLNLKTSFYNVDISRFRFHLLKYYDCYLHSNFVGVFKAQLKLSIRF